MKRLVFAMVMVLFVAKAQTEENMFAKADTSFAFATQFNKPDPAPPIVGLPREISVHDNESSIGSDLFNIVEFESFETRLGNLKEGTDLVILGKSFKRDTVKVHLGAMLRFDYPLSSVGPRADRSMAEIGAKFRFGTW